jgi:hypothetical protein
MEKNDPNSSNIDEKNPNCQIPKMVINNLHVT